MAAGSPPARPGTTARSIPPIILAAVLLLAGVGLFGTALVAAGGDFSLQGPRLAPVVVTAAWVIIAGLYLAVQLRPQPQPAEPADEEVAERPGWLAPAGVAAALAGFAVALEYAGFVVSAALFIVAVSRVLGSRSLIRDVIVAVILPTAVYLAFTRLLDIFLPAGVLPL
jgi:putative tricarboxylic transport membrane protein